jgi:hypothetical protein
VFPWGPTPRRHSSEDDEDDDEEAQEAAEEDDEEDEEQDDVRIRDAVGSFSELDHGMQGAKSDVRDRFMSCGDDEDGSFSRRSADQMSNPPIAVTVNFNTEWMYFSSLASLSHVSASSHAIRLILTFLIYFSACAPCLRGFGYLPARVRTISVINPERSGSDGDTYM